MDERCCYLSLIFWDLSSYLVSYAKPCSHECGTSLSIFIILSLACVIVERFGVPSITM
jgi:hypothetical protein